MRLFFMILFSLLICVEDSFALFTKEAENESGKVSFVVGSYEKGILRGGLYFNLNPDWKIYWRSPGEEGLPPVIEHTKSENIKNVEMKWPFPEYDRYDLEDFILESNVYSGNILIPLDIKAIHINNDLVLDITVSYLACKNSCMPYKVSFYQKIPKGENDEKALLMIKEAEKKLPVSNILSDSGNGADIKEALLLTGEKENQYIVVSVGSQDSLENNDMFVEYGERNSLPRYKKFIHREGDNNKFIFKANSLYENNISDLKIKVTLVRGNKAIEKDLTLDSVHKKLEDIVQTEFFSHKLFLMIMLAFLGGIILNVMPCVLPVISIKLMGIIKHKNYSPGKVKFIFSSTILGILSSFVILALFIIGFHTLGVELGWGFHFQEPLFIVAMLVIVQIFAANLFGWYEIHIPGFIAKIFGALKTDNKNVFLDNFFSGFLATILATPCSAPFLGTAISFALSRGSIEIFTIFLFMGIGFSSPYIVMMFFPSLLKKLPEPGAWMLKMKILMGMLLLATALWLLSIISVQLSIVFALILLLISCMNIAFIFFCRNNNSLFRKGELLFLGLFFLSTSYFVYFVKPAEDVKAAIDQNLWIEFKEDKIDDFVNEGKIVFVDITAKWCITCKLNKLLILDSEDFKKELLKEDFIAMRGDWTKRNKEITEYLKDHSRFGIPFNIIYSSKARSGVLLPELLTKSKVFGLISELRSSDEKDNKKD